MSTSEDILRSQNESLRKTIVAHGLRITDLQAEVARLRTALLAVEWVDSESLYPYCAWCSCRSDNGHASDCARQIALGLLEVAQ